VVAPPTPENVEAFDRRGLVGDAGVDRLGLLVVLNSHFGIIYINKFKSEEIHDDFCQFGLLGGE
jgi:hypothetical protein